ncbi:hypothetical protein KUTeg_007596 [Tegillarca granosa]|uniref:Uncharacterized protein n=1 Tax=Tegillarca granosa TaxID=220873 RepID=A0ABQ9FH27_TEGGR|nr:hypothetical protein KUTeg_007596 [Tegillarca granosa]
MFIIAPATTGFTSDADFDKAFQNSSKSSTGISNSKINLIVNTLTVDVTGHLGIPITPSPSSSSPAGIKYSKTYLGLWILKCEAFSNIAQCLCKKSSVRAEIMTAGLMDEPLDPLSNLMTAESTVTVSSGFETNIFSNLMGDSSLTVSPSVDSSAPGRASAARFMDEPLDPLSNRMGDSNIRVSPSVDSSAPGRASGFDAKVVPLKFQTLLSLIYLGSETFIQFAVKRNQYEKKIEIVDRF